MWTALLEILHQLSIKSLFQKVVLSEGPIHKKLTCQSCLFRLRCSVLTRLHSEQRKNKQTPVTLIQEIDMPIMSSAYAILLPNV